MSEIQVGPAAAPAGPPPHSVTDAEATEGLSSEAFSPWRIAVRKFFRRPMAVTGLVVLLVVVAGILFAPVVAPFGQNEQNLGDTLQSPDGTYWFGTDTLGRDNFSRVLYGGRVSLLVGVAVALIVGTVGTTVGMIAGYFGGWVDTVLMRITDSMLALPALMVYIVASQIIGRSARNVVIVLAMFGWMILARIVRGQVLALKEREFVESARALGVPNRRVITRHLLPNMVGVISVNVSLTVASAILLESTLSFLGLGVDATTTPTWGNMLSGSEGFVTTAPWLVWYPGMAIVITVLAINFIGDGLRDALDPTQGKG